MDEVRFNQMLDRYLEPPEPEDSDTLICENCGAEEDWEEMTTVDIGLIDECVMMCKDCFKARD